MTRLRVDQRSAPRARNGEVAQVKFACAGVFGVDRVKAVEGYG